MEKFVSGETEASTWVEDYEWVGIVYPQDVKPNATFITPLAFYDWDDGWRTITESERREYFPNNGKVPRFTGDFPGQRVKRLCWFQPVRNQRSSVPENTPSYSRYFSDNHGTLASERLAQVFDWSSRATYLFALPDLLNQGIPAEDCLSQTIFIRYRNLVYGPIHLEQDFRDHQMLKPREYSQRTSSFGQSLLLNGYDFAREKIVRLVDQSFIDQKLLGSPTSQADWSLPQMTVRRLLEASKSISVDLQEQQRLTERVIRELAALSASSGPEALRLEECVLQRAQYIVKHQLQRLDGLQELIEDLTEDHALLEKARQIEVQRRKERIAHEYESEQMQLQDLRREKQIAEATFAELKEKIAAADQKQEQMNAELAALETALPKRLMELREEMASLFQDLHMVPTLPLSHMDGREAVAETQQSEAPPAIHPPHYFIADSATIITSPHTMPWNELAAQNLEIVKHLKTGTAALLADLIPVVRDVALLQAIAQGIAGQRIWRVPVPLTAIDPLALFGSIVLEHRSFVPVAGELADIFIEVQAHPEQLGLIVLEGIDRVPFLPVIEPLLRQYRATRLHIQQTGKATPSQESLQLFHPRALAPEDPYQQISQLAWPANLLLGVTCDEDIGSFPLPERYNSWFVRIQYQATGYQVNNRRSGLQKSWQVSPTNWYAWEKESYERASSPDVLSLPKHSEPWQRIFHATLDLFGMRKDSTDIFKQLWPQQ